MVEDTQIKSKVWYLQVVGTLSYDHIGECLFFDGRKTDSAGNFLEEVNKYPLLVPHKLLNEIAVNDWLKIIDFYIDLTEQNEEELSKLNLPSPNNKKYIVGLKIDKYDTTKNMWRFLHENIYNIKKLG